MRYGWLMAIALAACGPSVSVAGERLRSVADAPSGKHVAVYRSSSFATERRDVPEDVVIQAMHASSMFFDEDVRALAPKIAPELGKLEADQRIVVETNDTAIYLFVATGELQIVGVREGLEVSHHASAIPSAAVRTELTPRPRAAAPVSPAPVVTPPVAVTPPPAVSPSPPRPVETVAAPIPPPPPPVVSVDRAKPKPPGPSIRSKPAPVPPATKQGPRLTEAQVRAKLEELDRLRAKDLITQDEYDQKKKALLDQL